MGRRGWIVVGCAAAASAACSRPAHEAPAVATSPSQSPPAAWAEAAPPSPVAGGEAPPPSAPACGEAGDVVLFVSPELPVRGQALRVVAVTEHPVDAALDLAVGAAQATSSDRQGGPPYFWLAQIESPASGTWRASLKKSDACGGGSLRARTGPIVARAPAPPPAPRSALWPTRRAWSASYENLYSAWIQHLFDAPLDLQPSFTALHDVLRDRSRNFLFDHLGAAEDEQGMVVRPDCADLPYFLRAYFAYKLTLPFGWSRCSRGENGVPPRCADFATSEDPFPPIEGKPQAPPSWADPERDPTGPWENNAKRVGEFFRTTLADAAQSGSGRTPADEDDSDYYPVPLSAEALRPGTIYGDPYGHVLVVSSRVPQSPDGAGVLLAVDGQPDGTVARKRFWRGNFLFAVDPSLGSAGFKRFRPLVRDKATGKLTRPKNAALADYAGTDQERGGVEAFYDTMDDVLSPAPLDPRRALLETLQALEEQVKTRVRSVDNGRKFLSGARAPAEMPDGEKIFETVGEWEDFSTPSRDLRLLIAIDVARALPARVARRASRYAMPAGQAPERVEADLEQRLASELHDRKFTYIRSDGSEWPLSLEDVVARQAALEMAYNPNDCVEQRWGALLGSPEASTCAAHAPPEQTTKMASYRSWFHERRRPPR
jgi:hypothetical protein